MQTARKTNNSWRIESPKPAGGFAFIKVEHLLQAWWSYQQGQIDLFAFRVWLACHELVARRCQISKKLKACYKIEELFPLTGSNSTPRHKKAIRTLESTGLLQWQGDNIILQPKPIDEDSQESFTELLNKVQNHKRKIPVPRRTIKYLASQRKKVLIASTIGHLIRCLYYKNNTCISGGRCKASWIADVFNVDYRNVKAARKELVDHGWLSVVPSSQLHLNRWGLAVTINLKHCFRICAKSPQNTETPPQNQLSTTKSPPPIKNNKLFTRDNNHKTQTGRQNGAKISKKRKLPNLNNITLEDLKQPAHLDSLFWHAVQSGMVSQSQASRLNFFAAAERALEVATSNPCGMFAHMVKHKLWHHITNNQEDTARRKLKMLDYGEGSNHSLVA